jgi:hypothetical protein
MPLDVLTLTSAGGLVGSLSGLFVLLYWWQGRTAWAASWRAVASCGMGTGIILLVRYGVPRRGIHRAPASSDPPSGCDPRGDAVFPRTESLPIEAVYG